MLLRWRTLLPRAMPACRLLSLQTASSLSPHQEIQNVLERERAEKDKQVPRFERYLQRFTNQAGKTAEFSPSDVWRVMYVCSRMERSVESTLVHALEQIDQAMLRSASIKDLSLCLYCLSVFHKKKWLVLHRELRDRVMYGILDELSRIRRLEKCNPIDLTQILYAMAVMDAKDIPQLRCLCQEYALERLKAFKGRECANLLWAWAKLEAADVSFLHSISQQAVHQWKSMKAREKSMTVWTWGCLGKDFKRYVRDVLSITFKDKEQPVSLKTQHYSNFLVALARLKFRGQQHVVENLVGKLLSTIQQEDAGEQSLANITWALGQLNYQNAKHLHLLAKQVVRPLILEQLTAQGMCNVLMGWAMMDMEDDESIETIAEEVTAAVRLPTFNHQELSLLNWSFGKLKLQKPSLVNRLVAATSQTHKIKQFNEKQLCAILQGWAGMQIQDQDAVQKLLREALQSSRLERFKTFELANLLRATGSLRVQNDHFYACYCKELSKKRRIFSLAAVDVKHALMGFQLGEYGRVAVYYFFRDVYEHWLLSGKLHVVHEPDLRSILSITNTLPYMDPALSHKVHTELERRRSQQESL